MRLLRLFGALLILALSTLPATGALGLGQIVPPSGSGPYVTPDDVGVAVGVGIVAPVPTAVVGSQTITVNGTVLENVVVDGCITIKADNVLIRNVEVRCAGFYPIKVNAAPHSNITVEYSRIEGLITTKLFLVNDAPNLTIQNNELVGGDDTMFAQGDLDGMLFTRNYRHSPLGDASSHYDGFQLGEFSRTYGAMEISYNYFEAIPDGIGVTDLIFATNEAEVAVSVIGNYIGVHGQYTLRAYNLATLDVRDNTIESTVPNVALLTAPGPHYFECNTFTDGTAVTEEDVAGSENATFGSCASLPAPPITVDELAGPQLSDQMARLFLAYFGRAPDAGGLAFWRSQRATGLSLSSVSDAFAVSPEFVGTYGHLDDASFVDLVYGNVLGRSPDVEGRAFWIGQLTAGMSRGTLMVHFSESPEFVELSGTVRPASVAEAQVWRLYAAYFLREADQEGFEYWVSQVATGTSLTEVSERFAGSAESIASYGHLDNSAFVDLVYANVLGRSADAEGRAFWLGELNAGMSRGSLMLSFSDSPEFILATDSLPPN